MNEDEMTAAAPEPMPEGPPPSSMGTHMVREPPADLDESRRALVKQLQDEITQAKAHWQKEFDQMKRDMRFSKGRQWPEMVEGDTRYVANFVQRHIQQRTATLYAKNPRFYAKRRKTLDFASWDGTPAQLQQVIVGVQSQDPASLQSLQDILQGTNKRKQLDRIAETLECVMQYQVAEQIPPFKTQMKQLVRRTLACKVGYLKIGFDRMTKRRPEDAEKITDATEQIAYLQSLMADMADDEIREADAQIETLRGMVAQLQAKPDMVVREGLVFDFPPSYSIIIDKRCRHLGTFIGCQWVAQEFTLSHDDVKEIYGVDMSTGKTGQSAQANPNANAAKLNLSANTEDGDKIKKPVTVWEMQHKKSGMVYVIAEGFEDFLQEPAPPEVMIDRFWTLFPLMFNELEDDVNPYPQSDVELLRPEQMMHNSAREGLREHRIAGRPATLLGGTLSEDDIKKLETHPPFAVMKLEGLAPGQKAEDLLQNIKKPPIDPAMYDTTPAHQDTLLVVGQTDASLGGTSNDVTATQSSIAEGSRTTAAASNVDDLDDFLNAVGRASGQILFANLSAETVKQIAGVGAVWPELTAQDISRELMLEVEGGSSGRPNEAAEMAKLQQAVPLLLQIPGVTPDWVANKIIKAIDSKVDLADAYTAGLPSIAMLNQQKQTTGAPPEQDPNNQGAQGADNAPAPQTTDIAAGQADQMHPAPMSQVDEALLQYLGGA
jgi:hypothetical protein